MNENANTITLVIELVWCTEYFVGFLNVTNIISFFIKTKFNGRYILRFHQAKIVAYFEDVFFGPEIARIATVKMLKIKRRSNLREFLESTSRDERKGLDE